MPAATTLVTWGMLTNEGARHYDDGVSGSHEQHADD